MSGKKQSTDENNTNIKGKSFLPTEEGSATLKNLDGKGITVKYEQGSTEYTEGFPGAPWSREDSLKFLCDEVGVNMDVLIEGIEKNKSDVEMAKEMGVEEETVKALKEHFLNKGLQSIEGQD